MARERICFIENRIREIDDIGDCIVELAGRKYTVTEDTLLLAEMMEQLVGAVDSVSWQLKKLREEGL